MWLALVFLPSALANDACDGPTVEQAAAALDAARTQLEQAQSRVNDTEWQYRLAIEERDVVLADRDDAMADLKVARAGLKAAKKDTKVAEEQLARCGGSPATESSAS